MSVHTAALGDIYQDEQGKLWRITTLCQEPTVTVEEVEPAPHSTKQRRSGGVSGAMWLGFRKLAPRAENKDGTLAGNVT